jgi:predicted regulator of Ras-like GTPase activity (Roadblock/LC7/MglB family)
VRTHVAEPWIEAPLQTFVDDARALFALLLHPNGQVMGQFGFTRAVDVMAACALAAAIHASAGELGRELDGKPFREMYHAGRDRQIFIGDVPTTHHRFVFLTVFDAESSLGLVRIYFEELCTLLEHAQPPLLVQAPISDASLEQDLNRNLAMLFGRAPRGSDGSESSISLA